MKLFLLTMILIANALGAYAIITCNHEHPGDVHLPGEDIVNSIRLILDGPGLALCNDVSYANTSDVLYYESPHYTFQIDRQQHTDTIENCKTAFESIMMECVIGEKMLGGEVYINNVVYEFYHTALRERDIRGDGELDDWMESMQERDIVEVDDDDFNEEEQDEEELGRHDLEVRRTSKANRPTKKPAKKPTKTKKLATKKPMTEKPKTKKPVPKQKPCGQQPATTKPKSGQKPKPGQKQSRALDAMKPKPGQKPPAGAGASCQAEDKLDCKTILAKYNANNAREQLATRDLDGESHGFVESVTHSILKRASKKGLACHENFNAKSYPNNAAVVMRPGRAPVFGWMHPPQQCQRMEWGSTQNNFQKVPLAQGGIYEVEHILEWQLVTKFFDWLSVEHFGGRKQFTDPDPKQNGAQIDFCEYWKITWNVPAFTIQLNGNTAHSAKEHIALQYPSSRGFEDEFVWLQKDINKPAKQHMWTRKNTNQIYDHTGALADISRNAIDAGVQALRVKALLGAQKYMKNVIINQFFIDQKQRIGNTLDELDNELPNHQPAPGHTPWQNQGLRNLWNTYMDEAFDKADLRTKNTMDEFLRALENKWVRPTERQGKTGKPRGTKDAFARQIRALATEWRKEKRSGWKRPNW